MGRFGVGRSSKTDLDDVESNRGGVDMWKATTKATLYLLIGKKL
jgi:hypothetical protein